MAYELEYYRRYEPLFGAWRIKKLIGEGSFGSVYEIVREEFGRTYRAALKTISVPRTKSEIDSLLSSGHTVESATVYLREIADSFINEFTLMSELKGHTNIVGYEDHAVITHEDGIGWDILIRMELLTPLLHHFGFDKATEDDVIRLGIDICRALEVCEKRSIIHRDIKPENIFVNHDGDFKLGDFGIAKHLEKTQSGLTKTGTPNYMAPEVYNNKPYGASVDIYSLGMVLYTMLNHGRLPFMPDYPTSISHGDSEKAALRRFSGEALPPPNNCRNSSLCDIILKACSYNPEDRFNSPSKMKKALENLQNNNAVSATDTQNIPFGDSNETVRVKKPPAQVPPVTDPGNTDSTKKGSSRLKGSMSSTDSRSSTYDLITSQDTPVKKRKKSKKGLIAVLICVALVGILALAAFLAVKHDLNNIGDNISWSISGDGVLTLSGTGDMRESAYLFDSELLNIQISYPWHDSYVKEIYITEGITSVSEYAFYNCSMVESITVPESLTEIGNYAFYNCTSLESVVLPQELNYIGNGAFASCTELMSVTVLNDETYFGENVFINTPSVKICGYLHSTAEKYASKRDIAFSTLSSDGKNDETISEGDTVAKDTSQPEITAEEVIGTAEEVITDDQASDTVPVQTACAHAQTEFYSEEEKIYFSAFDWTKVVNDKCTSCGELITKTVQGREVGSDTAVGFGSCGDNVYWVLDSNGTLTLRGNGSCTNYYNETTLPEYMDPSMRWENGTAPWDSKKSSIKSVVVENGVTSIGASMIDQFNNLTTVSLANTVTYIGQFAFYNCNNLGYIYIPVSVETIERGAFHCCDGIKDITVDANNPYYSSEDGVLFNKDKTVLIRYPSGSDRTSYTVPNSVRTLEYGSFSDSKKIKTIVLSQNLNEIGRRVFLYCEKLESISIPASVSYIEPEAFRNVTHLKNIYVSPYNNNYSSIDGVLYNKDGTKLLRYPCGKTNESFTISSNVTAIGEQAFHKTKVKYVFIPYYVNSIGDGAFNTCYNLQGVYIYGSSVSFGESVFTGSNNNGTLTIYGTYGSSVQTYANRNSIKFSGIY